MDIISALGSISTAFGLSSSAGLNAYIPLLIVSLGARFTPWITLSAPYDHLTNGWIIALLLILLLIEITVDKVPGVDTVNDIIQTFVRPVAGALLFAANANVINDFNPILALIAGLIIAGSVHSVKGAVRPMVTASTVGTGNWFVSLIEDILATLLSLLAILLPFLAGFLALIFLVWLIKLVWRRYQLS